MNSEMARILIEVHLREFDKLKDEQISRITFRDNLTYITLGVFGAVVSFAFTASAHVPVLLVVPLLSLVLGWSYVVNDDKISAIGRYLRNKLSPRLQVLLAGEAGAEFVFEWEKAHRQDTKRKRRKIRQLIVDELTFVGTGVASLGIYLGLDASPPWQAWLAVGCGGCMLMITAVDLLRYADLRGTLEDRSPGLP